MSAERQGYVERAAAKASGVALRHWKSARKAALQKEVGWWYAHNTVVLSEEGLEKALELLGLTGGQSAAPLEPGAVEAVKRAALEAWQGLAGESAPPPAPLPPPAAGAPRRALLNYERSEHLLSQRWANPHLLAAELEGQLQQVRVTDKTRFRPGMKLPCVHLHDNFWRLDRRAPRTPGRW